PKSKILAQVLFELRKTHAATVNALCPATMPEPSVTYWLLALASVSAVLTFPLEVQAGELTSVPFHPLPLESDAMLPLDSSNFKCANRSVGVALLSLETMLSPDALTPLTT